MWLVSPPLLSVGVTPFSRNFLQYIALNWKFRQDSPFLKLFYFFQNLVKLIKTNGIDGLEINLKQIDSKNDITDFISTIKDKLVANLYLAISVPSKPDVLAKYYDFKELQKVADLFVLQTSFLGASTNVTFHPSRLSGLWDMQNTVRNPVIKVKFKLLTANQVISKSPLVTSWP